MPSISNIFNHLSGSFSVLHDFHKPLQVVWSPSFRAWDAYAQNSQSVLFLPTFLSHPYNNFLSVLVCFLLTAFLRQKGNSLYLYWNVLSPFISALFFPTVFVLQLIGLVIHFLPFYRNNQKNTGFIYGCLNIILEIH